MNYSDYIVYDFETTSSNPETTQPVQIAAVIVHGRKLEIKKNSEFESLIQPVFDIDKCRELGLDPLTDDAVAVHGISAEILKDAPSLNSVFKNFTDYVNSYNFKKDQWSAPIRCGYNIEGFDNLIMDRIMTKDPYKLGPVSKTGRQGLFHPIHSVDVMKFMFSFFENDSDVRSLSADNLIRGKFGYSKGKAHDALSDVIMTAELFCKTQKWLRSNAEKIDFNGCMKDY